MNRLIPLFVGAVGILVFATVMLVVLPGLQVRTVQAPAQLQNYTIEQLRGRAQYVANGCVYCHSQQPRSSGQTLADQARGWGRPSTPGDYAYDAPQLLGTMRTGPDLLNVGVRLPSRDWQLTHLYQPRAIFDWSIMPSYPFLFEVKEKAAPGEVVVKLPQKYRPADGKVVVARQEALDLVAYLLSLDRSYPVSAKEATLRDRGYDPKTQQGSRQ
ncbi:cbb3-type cytochrome c oxidase subunit II [Pseudomonas aeruginosa]|jgi:cytochrome c oxidase cbb3-type subunit II|uniref:cbb3-type cytochrome c oxidase subunit II n=1 Tax=Pseudomonas aeruginosa TaxID=287 RepID=UPI000D20D6CF|nr:cbb3-type cytochrome c oxidase subunit II [Pseudomonas aeruginosa]AVZ19398.1 cytochrome-c oxidase [Pseudomonas aeruginosa]MCV3807410.1 cbb3-type cytochrome c oxidase subunit II [Pseudomonas aeruginosa]MCV3879173.1 cbb3-type cytochrome c oxidase subunit II [Pseudomonas aeruginosa]MCV3935404.1 cbb3-type cytochrome c oxidase subunit II [Pseudomonas aeruginosa]MCV3941731.1 cbb3-type cytochrome c oxidase subunit II [Pseudomonas aeruginosa]